MVRFNDLSTKQKASKEDRFDVLAAEIDAAATGDSSIAEDVSALKTAVGDAESGMTKDVADLKTAVGSEETEGSILARIKALEDAT
ncbi:MAG: hypothetical protein IJL02_03790 [Methanobrevibacter sp.]|uniref:hypothetical protein n=1 Tax=Methanobrevibacter sp. TaxID=66852 RepID=UPI0025DC770D|nr:hypothetical protein [Methanobrevibacter sp.]MBQ6098966.1 hypothetical protein [Methanobrevibacter sp.]